ncbi:unnamed protein product [Staurois parvus]|uniref:Uncharacterized protein n=1 Tax=Staurois parvus TaxID=386267 RepID=A0ABN9BB85_9NEOB|nr:unnamed protein product [Staurois parvus]
MGPCTASSRCCQAPNLPWAPVPPPHAAARSTVSAMGPCTGLPLLLSPTPHSEPCATIRSPHTAGGFHFCHRMLADYGPPPLLLPGP